MLNLEHSVSIVGAGISGIVCAITLARSRALEGYAIDVYEQSPRVGGRIQTNLLSNHYIDLGAARFCSQLHGNVYDLVKRFELEFEPFPFTQLRFTQPIQKELKTILSNLKPLIDEHKEDSFVEFVTSYLGKEKAKAVILALGYDSLSMPIISPHIAYDIIEKHPETQCFTENCGNEWFSLKEGLASLIKALYEEALKLGIKFHFESTLVQISNRGNAHSLVIADNQNQQKEISKGLKIITLPPSRMEKLDKQFPKRWSNYNYGSSPLFKGFFFYSEPWWRELGLTDHVVITQNPIRKLYFKDEKYAFFYTDSDNALYWRDVLSLGEDHYLTTVKKLIAEALNLPQDVIPNPELHKNKFWLHGVEFSKECCPKHPFYQTLSDDSVISLSDAYTHHCGWIEGGILAGKFTAESIISQLPTHRETVKEVVYL
ncbi:vioA-tryptophan 2-monooxygenase [Pseudoalteromonas luteoviolacea B = ATCC 29581]|nr:vioA-tryptophan 2-monooxygenase [Pseudoalteromonas luteoviolacea B = ATCC 29581]